MLVNETDSSSYLRLYFPDIHETVLSQILEPNLIFLQLIHLLNKRTKKFSMAV